MVFRFQSFFRIFFLFYSCFLIKKCSTVNLQCIRLSIARIRSESAPLGLIRNPLEKLRKIVKWKFFKHRFGLLVTALRCNSIMIWCGWMDEKGSVEGSWSGSNVCITFIPSETSEANELIIVRFQTQPNWRDASLPPFATNHHPHLPSKAAKSTLADDYFSDCGTALAWPLEDKRINFETFSKDIASLIRSRSFATVRNGSNKANGENLKTLSEDRPNCCSTQPTEDTRNVIKAYKFPVQDLDWLFHDFSPSQPLIPSRLFLSNRTQHCRHCTIPATRLSPYRFQSRIQIKITTFWRGDKI